MKGVIIIPARYGSSRLPGKPLEMICGKTMIERTYSIALSASKNRDCDIIIATEDQRIVDFCGEHSMKCVLTSESCKTGTDRVCEATKNLDYKPDYIINLQGDAPLTPPWFIGQMIDEFEKDSTVNMLTVGYQMTWPELDKMREDKKTTFFTGTTIVLNRQTRNAIWFSKNILPAIKKEEKYRDEKYSPVIRHIGLYGYDYDMLMKIGSLEKGYYEGFEELEQLRILENGYNIRVVMVDYKGRPSSSGVDNPEDIDRAEAIIKEFGEISE